MSKLRILSNKINTITRINKIVHGIEIIALQRCKKLSSKLLNSRHYLDTITNIIHNCSALCLTNKNHIYFIRETISYQKVVLFIFGLQTGLVGALKIQITEKIYVFLEKYKHKNVHMFISGNNTITYVRNIIDKYPFASLTIMNGDPLQQTQIFTSMIRDFMSGQIDSIGVLYVQHINITIQLVKLETILPIQLTNLTSTNHYINEQEIEKDFAKIIAIFLDAKLDFSFLNTQASEHSARYISMSAASKASKEYETIMRISYNKRRQANITQELHEITSGTEK